MLPESRCQVKRSTLSQHFRQLTGSTPHTRWCLAPHSAAASCLQVVVLLVSFLPAWLFFLSLSYWFFTSSLLLNYGLSTGSAPQPFCSPPTFSLHKISSDLTFFLLCGSHCHSVLFLPEYLIGIPILTCLKLNLSPSHSLPYLSKCQLHPCSDQKTWSCLWSFFTAPSFSQAHAKSCLGCSPLTENSPSEPLSSVTRAVFTSAS